ncbi:MAG: signal recognition particle-docking protein FtsY [Thermoplasmata archaeon]
MFKILREKLAGWKKKAPVDVEGAIREEGGRRISERKLDELLWDLEVALMEADVALPVIDEIKVRFKDELAGKRMARGVDFGKGIEYALRKAVEDVLVADGLDLVGIVRSSEKPMIIMFVGVNGTGKTTTIAKVAHLLKESGQSCVIAAADTFRAGAIEQLEKHAERLGVKLIRHKAGSDPAAVAYDAIEHAKARRKDVVLIDTAGRMQSNVNLMEEMRKIKRVAKPHLILFVGDALAGNDMVEQAVSFNDAVGVDAAILCKIDADAKGGGALSISHAIGKPIVFVGTGQEYDDLQAFDASWMTDRLFGGSMEDA